jgi:hypothetical protein
LKETYLKSPEHWCLSNSKEWIWNRYV